MPTNLAFDVVANTQEASDNLQLLNAQIRTTTSEVKKLATEANKDPLALPKFRAANAELTKLKQTAVTLNKSFHGTGEAAEHARRGIHGAGQAAAHAHHEFYLVENSLKSMSGSFQAIGHNLVGAKGAIAGFAVALGIEKVRDIVNEFSKSLGELRTAAGDLNLKPIQLQGAQHAVGAIGEEADIATKALEGVNAQMEELRKHPPEAGATGAGSAFGVQVSRGGQPTPSDFSKPLQMLGIEAQVAAISGSREPGANLKVARLEFQALVQQARNFNSTELNIISKNLFAGVPSNSMLKVAPTLLKNWQKAIEEVAHSSAGATDAALEEDKKLRISKDALSKQAEKAAGTLSTTLRPAQIAFNEILGTALVRDANQFQKDWGNISHAWASFWTVMGRITKAGAAEIRAEGKIDPANVLPDVNVTAGGLPQVFQGSGRGVDDSHGPVAGGAGYGPGSRATQSITPGTSDYQAPTPNVISPLLSGFGELAASSKSAAEAVADLAAASRSAAAASALAVQGSVVNPTIEGMASGGFVRGPGTGTSDSILARLSAGEFVVNSARVRQVGLGFMQRLNGFADGGLVPSMAFAAGGLVPSAGGGGTPVHLHLGGQSFVTHATSSVAAALVREASAAQMRSAGTKPSWFASRPGG